MLSESNFLILDEPTNHLDITSKEILENALNHYTGTVLYISHDRYFINKTATRILELKNQTLINYLGNYDYYLEKKEELTSIYAPCDEETKSKTTSSKEDWKSQKEEHAKLRKKQNELTRIEEEIHQLETRDKEMNELLTKEEIYTNVEELVKLNKEKKDIADKLEILYEKWEELAE